MNLPQKLHFKKIEAKLLSNNIVSFIIWNLSLSFWNPINDSNIHSLDNIATSVYPFEKAETLGGNPVKKVYSPKH